MDPSDYLEPWMVDPKNGGDEGDFLRGLFCRMFWFPVDYHPELGDPFEPARDDEVPFWTEENGDGKFVAAYSAPELLDWALESAPQRRHTRARMKGADIIVALRDANCSLVINPWPDITIVVPAEGIRTFGHALVGKIGQS
jgi:hypothetical protein